MFFAFNFPAIALSPDFVNFQDFSAIQFSLKAPTVWRRFP